MITGIHQNLYGITSTMPITETDFDSPSTSISVLDKGLHGGFIEEDELVGEEKIFCERTEWIEGVVKFRCDECGDMHTSRPMEMRCLRTNNEVEPSQIERGYRLIPDQELQVDIGIEYDVLVEEHTSAINERELPYKSIVFVPDVSKMVFSDKAGSTVYLPLDRLPGIFTTEERDLIISGIDEKRRQLIDWDSLNPNGEDFQEMIYRLIERDDDYSNVHWGGTGPDQGKDAFCSIVQGGRETNVLVQMKFNNYGQSVNDSDIERYIRKAGRHDCRGLIVAAVRTSGDLETDFYDGNLLSRDMTYLEMWSGPKIKERLAEHPDLIAEYFIE
jgi:hypothetical protein